MTKDQWTTFLRNRREEAVLSARANLLGRVVSVTFEVIEKLSEIIFDMHASPALVGPCSPRDARDEVEGEAVAPTDHSRYDYCPVSWEGNGGLCCTRPEHETGDHVVSKGGKIIARWPS